MASQRESRHYEGGGTSLLQTGLDTLTPVSGRQETAAVTHRRAATQVVKKPRPRLGTPYSPGRAATEDYWTHRRPTNKKGYRGLDLRDQDTPVLDQNGTYSTHLFAQKAAEMIKKHEQTKPMFLYLSFQAVHGPLQVPEEYLKNYMDVKDPIMRTYAAQVQSQRCLADNRALAGEHRADNGARELAGSNWPLRGWKNTLWEGGVRAVGFVNSNLLEKKGRIKIVSCKHVRLTYHLRNERCTQPLTTRRGVQTTLLHLAQRAIDVRRRHSFPTFSEKRSRRSLPKKRTDKKHARIGKTSPRKELLHNIDPFYDAQMISYSAMPHDNIINTSVYAAIRSADWKLLTGYQGAGWMRRRPTYDGFEESADPPDKHLWLFNIRSDPQERTDLSKIHPDIVQDLLEKLARYNKTAERVLFVAYVYLKAAFDSVHTPFHVEAPTSHRGESVEVDQCFNYLGSLITSHCESDQEVKRRLEIASAASASLNRVWRYKHLSRTTKVRTYNTLVLSFLLYGAETWTITKSLAQKLDAFDPQCLRKDVIKLLTSQPDLSWRRPRARWEGQLFPTLQKLGVRGDWRTCAGVRDPYTWRVQACTRPGYEPLRCPGRVRACTRLHTPPVNLRTCPDT
ncbi:hypothetical protein Bbelb_393280 [Branchiostoma belcheri]|nr:hypothetical protein Bbelb_393280 [Branchiostoma belcheri]